MPLLRGIDDLLDLLRDEDAKVQQAVISYINSTKGQADQQQLVQAFAESELEKALEIIKATVQTKLGGVFTETFNTVGDATAEELQGASPDATVSIVFNPGNVRATEIAAQGENRLIEGFTEQQFAATRQAVERALASGGGPAQIASAIRNSIGLTPYQEAYVDSYRRQLEQRDSAALSRALRDRRFDGTVRTAIGRDKPLSEAQIDMMVNRYRAAAIMNRAETIGRTESLTAYSQAREEALQQMIEQTRTNARVVRVWNATHDSRTRLWHMDMDGQRQPPGVPFTDGLGNMLMFPGDPLSPPETRINCRCTLGFEVDDSAE